MAINFPERTNTYFDYPSEKRRAREAATLMEQLRDYDLPGKVLNKIVRHVGRLKDQRIFHTLHELRSLDRRTFLEIDGFGERTWQEFSSRVPPPLD